MFVEFYYLLTLILGKVRKFLIIIKYLIDMKRKGGLNFSSCIKYNLMLILQPLLNLTLL